MVFESVRPSCSCSNVALSCMHLEPGEEGLLTGSYRGKGRPGSVAQSIDLVVAKPRRVGIRIPVVGDVRSRIQVEPDVLVLEPDFLSAAVGKAPSSFGMHPKRRSRCRRRRAYRGVLPRPSRRSLPPGAETELVFQAAPFLVVPSDEEFTLDCTHSVEKNVVVTVKVRPKGAIRVDPPERFFRSAHTARIAPEGRDDFARRRSLGGSRSRRGARLITSCSTPIARVSA